MSNLFKVHDIKNKENCLFSVVVVLISLILCLYHVAPNSHCRGEKVQSGPNFQICSAPSGPSSFNYLSVYLRTSCVWNRTFLKYHDFLLRFPRCVFIISVSQCETVSPLWFWKDTARKQQALLSSALVQTCQHCVGLLLTPTEESDLGSSDTYCKKVNG